ncbi:MAG: AtpZ/AtpI family protein [Deltaproteobacteria bacterium]|nr:AtpZ/AtpI family protein [Deltaproteobacteria bacterium]
MDLDKESLRRAALGFATVTEVVVYTVIGYFIGHYLDRWLNTNPWLAGLFTLVGFIGGFYRLYTVLKDDNDKSDKPT